MDLNQENDGVCVVSKYDIDYDNSKQMWDFQMETLEKADSYAEHRNKFAEALKVLKLGLIKGYKDGTIEKKHSEDKAFLMLADQHEDYKKALMNLIEYENRYKGYEKILDARKGALSFNQSLIKVMPK